MRELENPFMFETITELLEAFLDILMIVTIPIVIFMLIYAGFMYVTARGRAEQLQTASRALLYGVIGGVVIVGARAIVFIINNVVDSF